MSIPPDKVVERSVDSLQRIYAVIIALAISRAIETLLKNPNGGALDLSFAQLRVGLSAFIAFLVTLIPFWQGMNRHLDRCYLEKKTGIVQRALLFDFLFFFVEAIFLFAAGWSVKSGIQAFYWLGALLFVDMAWSVASHFIHFPGTKSHAVRWSVVNAVAILAAILVIEYYPFEHEPFVLMVVALTRSIADYGFGRDFYFPGASDPGPKSTS